MVCHILCPDCGEDLAEIYPAYEAVKNAYFDQIIKKHSGIAIEKIELKLNLLPETDFIFKALHITNQCCRMHILALTDFD